MEDYPEKDKTSLQKVPIQTLRDIINSPALGKFRKEFPKIFAKKEEGLKKILLAKIKEIGLDERMPEH